MEVLATGGVDYEAGGGAVDGIGGVPGVRGGLAGPGDP